MISCLSAFAIWFIGDGIWKAMCDGRFAHFEHEENAC
jgi:hypothetical protein